MKHSWTFGGSMILAAASGIIAVAEDGSVPGRATISEQPVIATPSVSVGESIVTAPDSASSFQSAPTYIPPYQPAPQCRYGYRNQRFRSKYWGYPEEFCEPPLGTTVLGHGMAQIANGQAARMALYRYDFVLASDQLNARGKAQLAKIATWLPANDFPLFVEPTPATPELDELRRQAVWRELSTHHFSVPAERIILGRPNVRGLDAGDALLLDRNRLSLTFSRGVSAGGGATTGDTGGTSNSSTGTSGATGTTGQTN